MISSPRPVDRTLRRTLSSPGSVLRAARTSPTRQEGRRAVLLGAAAVVLPVLALGGGYLAVVRRPVGADAIARMSHREAGPSGRAGPQAVVPPEAGADGAGGRPPVVLVHGLGMSGYSMRGLMKALGQHTRVLAPDLPGYGRSPQPRSGTLDVTELADAVAAWMRTHDVGPAVLAGHSLGAQVAGQVALRAPELVLGLVLIAPTGDPARPRVRELAGRLLRDAFREEPALWLVAAVDYVRAGPGQMVALMRQALRQARQQPEQRFTVPLLVVRGQADLVCRQGWCEELVSSVDDARSALVPGAHGVTFTPPAELVRLVLREVDTAASRAHRARTVAETAPAS